jgi:hypothetical protein
MLVRGIALCDVADIHRSSEYFGRIVKEALKTLGHSPELVRILVV